MPGHRRGCRVKLDAWISCSLSPHLVLFNELLPHKKLCEVGTPYMMDTFCKIPKLVVMHNKSYWHYAVCYKYPFIYWHCPPILLFFFGRMKSVKEWWKQVATSPLTAKRSYFRCTGNASFFFFLIEGREVVGDRAQVQFFIIIIFYK